MRLVLWLGESHIAWVADTFFLQWVCALVCEVASSAEATFWEIHTLLRVKKTLAGTLFYGGGGVPQQLPVKAFFLWSEPQLLQSCRCDHGENVKIYVRW